MGFFDKFRRTPSPSPSRALLDDARRELDRAADPRRRAALMREVEALAVEVAFDDVIGRVPEGPSLAAARDQLQAFNKILAAEPDLSQATLMLIELAIHHGAPIYNAGSHIGCAYVYDYAARLVQRLLEGPAGRQGRLLAVSRRLAEVSFDPITPAVANRRAWSLRHAFDEIGALLTSEADEPARKDVFISHASPDRAAADRLVESLETAGIHCWIAPRDIPAGSKYGAAIVEAIQTADSTLVLLSSHSNASRHVADEIERAAAYDKTIIPVRLEDVTPSRNIELHVGGRQRVDLWDGHPQRDENLKRLIEHLRRG